MSELHRLKEVASAAQIPMVVKIGGVKQLEICLTARI